MPQVLDIEQAVLLLEVEPPFDKREVQLARRRLAKHWHPDIAPPGQQLEHQRHLKAINEAADQLERLAEESRGGKRHPQRRQGRAAAARKRRAEEAARAYEEEQRQRAQHAEQRQARPVRLARARPLGRPPLRALPLLSRVGRRQRHRHLLHRRRRRHPAVGARELPVGVRTVPAGSLQFVDFSKPDPGAERVERFMTAAQHALAEGDFKLAARRLVYARDADPRNPAVLRLLTPAFWQAGDYPAAARAVRDWARVESDRPAPTATPRGSTRTWARSPRPSTRPRSEAAARAGRRLRLGAARPPAAAALRPRGRARGARARARRSAPSEQGLLDLALVDHLAGDVGAEVTACEQATQIAPESRGAWSRYAHALARTDRMSRLPAACERALELADDPEVADLRERVLAAAPRELHGARAA